MVTFIGRHAELALLDKRLARVEASGSGAAVALRGRRQIGKSRLVQEFCDRADVPYVFFTATKGASPVEAVSDFLAELANSSLPIEPELVPSGGSGSWPDAFPGVGGRPAGPSRRRGDRRGAWLAEQDTVFDGALQTAWDRLLSRRPVLLLLLGSDLHMMEAAHRVRPTLLRARRQPRPRPAQPRRDRGRAGTGRGRRHRRAPGVRRPARHPACVAARHPGVGIPGGRVRRPRIAGLRHPRSLPPRRVPRTRSSPTRPGGGRRRRPHPREHRRNRRRPQRGHPVGLAVPTAPQTGRGETGPGNGPTAVHRPGKPALYRVDDSNLRLYLAILRGAQEQVRRGRPASAFRLVERRWSTWRGRAVEPLVREALELASRRRCPALGRHRRRRRLVEPDLRPRSRPGRRRPRTCGPTRTPRRIRQMARRPLRPTRHGKPDHGGSTSARIRTRRTTLAVVSLSGLTPDLPTDPIV